MFEGSAKVTRHRPRSHAWSTAFAHGQTSQVCGMPAKLDDGWTIAAPDDVDLDGARLCTIEQRLKLTDSDIHAVVIARHGKLAFEQYFAGIDQPWGKPEARYEYDATALHDMRSATKSVTSLLVGIAIDRRMIKSVNTRIVNFFPQFADVKTPGWENVRLRHLLTMSSGIKWDETLPWSDPDNDEPHLAFDPDPLRYVLSKPIAVPPDTVWVYNGGGTELLGAIIERTSGMPLEAFAREFFFKPARCRPISNGRPTRTARSPPRPGFACARATPPRSASCCSATAPGTAGRSSRRTGSCNR